MTLEELENEKKFHLLRISEIDEEIKNKLAKTRRDLIPDYAKFEEVLNYPIEKLRGYNSLLTRTKNNLKNSEIETLGKLLGTSETNLLSYRNIGKLTIKDIKDNLLGPEGLDIGIFHYGWCDLHSHPLSEESTEKLLNFWNTLH